jgi:hypothetical protein
VNTALYWLYQQSHDEGIPSGNARCYLCSASCEDRYSVKAGIADTFNSHYLAACPSSPYLCAACQWYFDGKANHPDFRKMSLIVAERNWQHWRREDMKTELGLWLAHGLEADAYLVVSLSKKKHILLQAPLNTAGTKLLAIQVEEQVAYLDQSTWQIIGHSFMFLLSLGHGKGEILSGKLYSNTLRKHGQMRDATKHSAMLEPYRGSATLDLYSYATIIEIEKEESDDRPIDTARTGGETAASGLQPDRQRVQEQVPRLNLGTGRKQRGGVLADYEQPDLFS